MEITITQYILVYFIYAFLGWLLEVACKLKESKKFVNRGFLIGPYCPIYGWGAIAITLLSYRYKEDPVALFVMTVVTCGILEYVTSWAMEKLFKARWWDYSNRKFNLNGRVCLGTLIPFGLFGLLLTYVTNPFIIAQLNKVEPLALNIITIVIAVAYIVDNVVSGVVIFGFRKTTVQVGKEGRQDNTEEITKKVKEILLSRSWIYRRLVAAFPKFVSIKYKIKEITDDVKTSAQEVKNNINEKAQEVRDSVSIKTEEVINNLNEKTEEMKMNWTDTSKAITKEWQRRQRKSKISLRLGKHKLRQRFKEKK